MLRKYMKFLPWVIITLLLIIAAVLLLRRPAAEQDFQGIFIFREWPMHVFYNQAGV